jgi:hypothetical protein
MVHIRFGEPLKCIAILHSQIINKLKHLITTEGSHPSRGAIQKQAI